MVEMYTPEKGDIVWVNFEKKSGKEQAGKRPALVLSPKKYNEKVGLALLCPITKQAKGYPFEVPVKTKKITGVILADHIKSIDFRAKKATFITKSPQKTTVFVLHKIQKLLFS